MFDFTEQLIEEMAINCGTEPQNYIQKGGHYRGIIATAKIKPSKTTQAEFLEFNFISDDNEKAKLSLIVKTGAGDITDKNGNPLSGIAMLAAICRLNGITKLSEPEKLEGVKIGVLIKMVDSNGYYKAEPLQFFDYKTNQSYRERAKNLPPKEYQAIVKDDPKPATKTPTTTDYDLPY